MREIESNSEARLSRALRSLSASSPAEAPPEIGEALTGAFRHHHTRRRLIRRTALAAAIVILLLPVVVVMMRKHPAGPVLVKSPAPATVLPSVVAPAAPVAVVSSTKARVKRSRSTLASGNAPRAERNDFVVLPSSDQAVRGEELRVIRLNLTVRELQMVGAPVSEEIADRRILADFVVGQDNTPYAVRLVR
jgi:hypothetical protein